MRDLNSFFLMATNKSVETRVDTLHIKLCRKVWILKYLRLYTFVRRTRTCIFILFTKYLYEDCKKLFDVCIKLYFIICFFLFLAWVKDLILVRDSMIRQPFRAVEGSEPAEPNSYRLLILWGSFNPYYTQINHQNMLSLQNKLPIRGMLPFFGERSV